MTPGPLSDADRSNFNTLQRAGDNSDLALISAIRKADQKQVALVCAMQADAAGMIMPIPLAVMIEGNPFEDFEDPTVD